MSLSKIGVLGLETGELYSHPQRSEVSIEKQNKVFDTVNEYIKGTYTKKEAIQYINVAGFDQQIVFKTEKAIQSLKFIKRELLEPDEKAFIKLQANKDRKSASDKLDRFKKRNSKKNC